MTAERGQDFQKGDNYSAWAVKETDYTGIASLVQWEVLSPSSHNTQPWRATVDGNSIVTSPELRRHLKVSDPTMREMYISLGAAIANLKVAAHHFGWQTEEVVEKDNEGLVSKRVSFLPDYTPTEEDKQLFHTIIQRVSNRNAHEARSLPSELKEVLSDLNQEFGIETALIEDTERKTAIGNLVARGEEEIFSDPQFRNELAGWIKDNSTRDFDGMPTFGFTSNSLLGWAFLRAVRSGLGVWEIAAKSRKLFKDETAAVGVISASDDPEEWMKVGEAFQIFALKVASMGISTNILAVLIETGEYHKDLQKIADLSNRPQMMFRIGYSSVEVPHSPRYPASYVVSAAQKELNVGRGNKLKPQAFTIEDEENGLENLKHSLGEDVRIVDRYGDFWLPELFVTGNPAIKFTTTEGEEALTRFISERNKPTDGVWVYYPWRNAMMHILGEEEFYKLVYSRNFPSIVAEDQQRLGKLPVGVAGLSLGRNIVWALAMTGIRHLSIADFDTITPSNLDRMVAVSLFEVGENKTESLAKALYEFNPYLDLRLYPEGLNDSNINSFVRENAVLIDAMDAFPFKAKMRFLAKALGKIVVMGTDTAMRPIREIETPKCSAFGGRVDQETIAALMKGPKNKKEASKMVAQVMGFQYLPGAVMKNFLNVYNDEQNYWSQLGVAALAVAAQVGCDVLEIVRGNVDKLQALKVVDLQQGNLIDKKEEERVRREFIKTFGLTELPWWRRALNKLPKLQN